MLTKSFALKSFFRFFPKGWWIVLSIAFVLKLLAPELEQAWNMWINLALTFLFLKLSVITHECGHLVAAHFAGGTPKRMALGSGHEIHRTEIADIKVILNATPVGGYAIATFGNERYMRLRYAVFVAGGVLANLIVAAIFYLLFGFELRYFNGKYGVNAASALIFSNLIMIINLFPFYTSAFGIKLSSDGLSLLQLLVGSNGYKKLGVMNEYFEAYEYFEKHEYDKAYAIYQKYHTLFPEEALPLLNMSAIHLRRGNIDEALNVLIPLAENAHLKKWGRYKGLIFNNLAWAWLVKDDTAQAHHFASLAIKAMPRSHYAWSTWGAALVGSGNVTEGMKWLYKNMDLEHPNSITLTASIFLMLAFHIRGNHESRDLHLNYVKSNIENLEVDERMIFEINLRKMGLYV